MNNEKRDERCRIIGMIFLFLHCSEDNKVCECPGLSFSLCVFTQKQRDSLGFNIHERAANEWAEFLGFESRQHMESFFGKNETLWGNDKGYDMFYEPLWAYDAWDKPRLTLEMIGIHWLEVAERIEIELKKTNNKRR